MMQFNLLNGINTLYLCLTVMIVAAGGPTGYLFNKFYSTLGCYKGAKVLYNKKKGKDKI